MSAFFGCHLWMNGSFYSSTHNKNRLSKREMWLHVGDVTAQLRRSQLILRVNTPLSFLMLFYIVTENLRCFIRILINKPKKVVHNCEVKKLLNEYFIALSKYFLFSHTVAIFISCLHYFFITCFYCAFNFLLFAV